MIVYRGTEREITEEKYHEETEHFFIKKSGNRDAKKTSWHFLSTNLKEVQKWRLEQKKS